LDRVLEIAASLPEAPHWPAAAYLAAIDPENSPRRIALVVVETSDGSDAGGTREEQTAGAKALVDSIGFVPGMNPRPTARTSHSAGAKALNPIAGSSARLKSCPDTEPCRAPDRSNFFMEGEALACQSGERIIGFAVASLLVPEAELETIAVAPAFQRRRLGVLLLRALAGELRKEHVKEVLLEVRASNRTGLGFYREQGFEESGRRVGYYVDPAEDAVLMRLKIE
jgi:ribosomal-protein-alanine acetyltransferase